MISPERVEGGVIRQFAARLRVHWLIKTLGLTFGITAFFAAYFYVLRNPVYPVTVMPVIALDRMIGFQPGALPLYVSLWVYVPLAFVLLQSRRELAIWGTEAFVLSVIGLGIFFVWPTTVPVLAVDWSRYPSFEYLKTVDASGNACPSLHVAFAVFTAIRVGGLLRKMSAGAGLRFVNWLWCAGIVYSTIATGQHVALDAVAGVVLGALVARPWAGRATVAGTGEPANCSAVGTTQR